MKWIGNRISYVDTPEKTTIIITPERVGVYKAIIGAWFFMWLTIGAVMIWAWDTFEMKASMKDQLTILLVIFLAFWMYYAVRVGRTFFWLMYGSEFLKIDKISFSIKTAIKKYGTSKEYFIENIDKISLAFPEKNSFQAAWENSPWIRGGERLTFDHKGKSIRFGRKLDEKDAKLLFQLITKRIEEQLKKKNKKTD